MWGGGCKYSENQSSIDHILTKSLKLSKLVNVKPV